MILSITAREQIFKTEDIIHFVGLSFQKFQLPASRSELKAKDGRSSRKEGSAVFTANLKMDAE